MKKVIIADYTDIEKAKEDGFYKGSSNSGTYAFYEIYRQIDKDLYEVEYDTSADFEYCHIFGNFQQCYTCWKYDDEKGCIAYPEKITKAELMKRIEEAKKYEYVEVDIEY